MSRQLPRRCRFGQIDCYEIEGATESKTIILLHGFGASFDDLVSLSQTISLPKIQTKKGLENTRWIFPNGHLKVELGPHMEGRAWFPISLAEMQRASLGTPIDFTTLTPPGLKRAREMILDMVTKLNVPWEKVILGGFSQGAMVAVDVALHAPQPPAAVVILSGTLINATDFIAKSSLRPGVKFFQSHGKQDPILPYAAAVKLEGALKKSGWIGQLISFDGGHEIPFPVLSQLQNFLRQIPN